MTFSKVVSGMGGAPSGLLKSGTNIASKSGKDWVSYGGRRADLDPALTFWAQLNRDTRDVLGAADTFTRASDGLYLPYNGADWRIAGTNAPRHEDAKLLIEPAITNKVEVYNAEPDVGLTNWTGGGLSGLSRVFRPDIIAAAGLKSICTSGYVYRIYDSPGDVLAGGGTGNTNDHRVSVFAYVTRGTFRLLLEGDTANEIEISENSGLVRIDTKGVPSLAVRRLMLRQPSTVGQEECFFILPQLEESAAVTSPIITQGAAGQRAIDALQWANLSTFFNQTEGMLGVKLTSLFDVSDTSPGENDQVISIRNGLSILYWQNIGGNWGLVSLDGTNTVTLTLTTPSPAAGEEVFCWVRWKTTPAELQIGAKHNGVWDWSTVGLYDGAFIVDDILRLNNLVTLPKKNSDLLIYNEDRGVAWVEANY